MVVAGERERERSRRKEKQTDLLVMGGEGGFLISFLSQFSQLRLLFFFERERKKERDMWVILFFISFLVAAVAFLYSTYEAPPIVSLYTSSATGCQKEEKLANKKIGNAVLF